MEFVFGFIPVNTFNTFGNHLCIYISRTEAFELTNYVDMRRHTRDAYVNPSVCVHDDADLWVLLKASPCHIHASSAFRTSASAILS